MSDTKTTDLSRELTFDTTNMTLLRVVEFAHEQGVPVDEDHLSFSISGYSASFAWDEEGVSVE